jgi:hypothetical protein
MMVPLGNASVGSKDGRDAAEGSGTPPRGDAESRAAVVAPETGATGAGTVSEAGPVALAEVVSGPGLREGIGVDGGG